MGKPNLPPLPPPPPLSSPPSPQGQETISGSINRLVSAWSPSLCSPRTCRRTALYYQLISISQIRLLRCSISSCMEPQVHRITSFRSWITFQSCTGGCRAEATRRVSSELIVSCVLLSVPLSNWPVCSLSLAPPPPLQSLYPADPRSCVALSSDGCCSQRPQGNYESFKVQASLLILTIMPSVLSKFVYHFGSHYSVSALHKKRNKT